MDARLVGKRVTVMGLGHFGGGIGAVRWLAAQGAKVTVTDVKPAAQLADGLAAIRDLLEPAGPVTLALGGHRAEDFTAADLVVASPAVPPTNPYLQQARAAGVPVSTEIQLLLTRLPAGITTVGITGSNGKSTTTALIAHLLQAGIGQPGVPYRRVWLGGNIGVSLLDELPNMAASDILVLELSSFMLEAFEHNGLRWSPGVAVVTNLSPNHLDRHGTMDAYGAAKQVILAHQRPGDLAVLNADDEATRGWASLTAASTLFFETAQFPSRSVRQAAPGWVQRWEKALRLPGRHNVANAAAALTAVTALPGYANVDLCPALQSFAGLPHRLEFVGEVGQVRFYNDSKATTPEAAMLALESFAAGAVVAIAGGSDKGVDLAPFARTLGARCRAVVLVGQVGPRLANLIPEQSGSHPLPPIHVCETFAEAVKLAAVCALPGDVVLLSPGCASYGMFAHYEERGQRFAELVRGLGPRK